MNHAYWDMNNQISFVPFISYREIVRIKPGKGSFMLSSFLRPTVFVLVCVHVPSLYVEPWLAHSEAAGHPKSHGAAVLPGTSKEHR